MMSKDQNEQLQDILRGLGDMHVKLSGLDTPDLSFNAEAALMEAEDQISGLKQTILRLQDKIG